MSDILIIPRISIGLPVFNGEKHLRQTINSVLSQTFQNFELLISDDASADSSYQVCSRFALKDKRIKLFRQRTRLGLCQNHNFLLFQANADFFIWINQDDYWEKNVPEKLLNLFNQNKHASLAGANMINFLGRKQEKYPTLKIKNTENKFQSLLNFIKSGSLIFLHGMYKTSILKSIGGYQKSSRPFFKSSDYMTIFRVLLRGPMVFTNEYLFNKRDTGNYLNRYEDLRKLKITKNYMKKVVRYLFFPLFFVYDTVSSLKCIFLSDFSFYKKIKLIFACSIYFFKRLLEFIKSILYGTYCFLKNITK